MFRNSLANRIFHMTRLCLGAGLCLKLFLEIRGGDVDWLQNFLYPRFRNMGGDQRFYFLAAILQT